MSFWYKQQYKNSEHARARNKREERRLYLEMNRKHGMRDIHKYRISEVAKEQRVIQKELERIRLGVHRRPVFVDSTLNIGSSTLNSQGFAVPRTRLTRQEDGVVDTKNANDNLSPRSRDNAFLKAIMYVQSDREALHDRADCIHPHNSRDAASIGGDLSTVAYPLLSMPCRSDKPQKNTFADNSYPHRDIDPTVKGKTVEFVSEEGCAIYVKQGQPKPILKLSSLYDGSSELDSLKTWRSTELDSPRTKPRQARFSLDLVSLASLDMKSVKSNVSRRLSQEKKPSPADPVTSLNVGDITTVREVHVEETSGIPPPKDETDAQSCSEANPKEKTKRRQSKTKPPPPNQHLDFDPEQYMPDGSLRKIHEMPAFDKAWEQAQKARYIRTRNVMDRDRELSVNEIFDKKKGAGQTSG